MSLGKKLLLVAAALCAVAVPVLLGQAQAARRIMLAAVAAAPKPVRVWAAAHTMIAEEQTPSTGLIAEGSTSELSDDPCATSEGATFDVISIKPSKASRGDWDSEATADGVTLSGTAKSLIQESFGLRDFQVTGGPDWVASDTFDIRAKFDVPEKGAGQAARKAIAARWVERYRSLLQERFEFKCHMTTKELPVYDLVVTKRGPKLKPTAAGEGNAGSDSDSSHADSSGIHTVVTGLTTQGIATMLARFAGRTVVDKTGLTGRYDFTLDWKTEKQAERSPLDGEGAPLPELPTALEEQVGLMLVPSKGPVPVLVIDHIEKPAVDGAEVPSPGDSSAGEAGKCSGPACVLPIRIAFAPQNRAAAPPSAPTIGAPLRVAADSDNRAPVEMPSIKFDVISFKRCPDNVRGSIRPQNGGDFLAYHCEPILQLIHYAYTTAEHPFLMTGEPGWVDTDAYEFEGKVAPEDVAAFQKLDLPSRRMMMRGMLADVLKLQLHPDPTPHSVYDLVVGKGGSKLSAFKDGETNTLPNGQTLEGKGMATDPDSTTYYQGETMPQFAEAISTRIGKQVIDKTNLPGQWDFKTFMPAQHYSPNMENSDDSPIPHVMAGVKALGLDLVSAKETHWRPDSRPCREAAGELVLAASELVEEGDQGLTVVLAGGVELGVGEELLAFVAVFGTDAPAGANEDVNSAAEGNVVAALAGTCAKAFVGCDGFCVDAAEANQGIGSDG